MIVGVIPFTFSIHHDSVVGYTTLVNVILIKNLTFLINQCKFLREEMLRQVTCCQSIPNSVRGHHGMQFITVRYLWF